MLTVILFIIRFWLLGCTVLEFMNHDFIKSALCFGAYLIVFGISFIEERK